MVKFTEKEYKYILDKMKEDRKYFDTCTKEELIKWLENINGANYDTVILFTEYEHTLEGVNTSKAWNDRVINYMDDIGGMWIWIEHGFDRDEVAEYEQDPIYLDIYEKILNDDEE